MFITVKIAFFFTSLTAVQLYDFNIFTAIYSPLHGFIWNQHSDHYCEDCFYIHFILSFRYGVSGFPTIKFFPRDSEEAEEVSCITKFSPINFFVVYEIFRYIAVPKVAVLSREA